MVLIINITSGSNRRLTTAYHAEDFQLEASLPFARVFYRIFFNPGNDWNVARCDILQIYASCYFQKVKLSQSLTAEQLQCQALLNHTNEHC